MISARGSFSFTPKWKEELVCETPWAKFTVEMTMGSLHVYFPNEEKWKSSVPEHLHDKWAAICVELQPWCQKHDTLFSTDSSAWIEFENE